MTQMNIRIDSDVKKNAESALKDMGLSLSAAITMFLTKVGRERRIPFEVTADSDPFYSQANMDRLRRSIAQMEETGGTIHEVNYDD